MLVVLLLLWVAAGWLARKAAARWRVQLPPGPVVLLWKRLFLHQHRSRGAWSRRLVCHAALCRRLLPARCAWSIDEIGAICASGSLARGVYAACVGRLTRVSDRATTLEGIDLSDLRFSRCLPRAKHDLLTMLGKFPCRLLGLQRRERLLLGLLGKPVGESDVLALAWLPVAGERLFGR